MSAIFNAFHISQLKKCLRLPKEAIESTNVKTQSDLTYEEKPIWVIEEMERVTRSKVVKFYKVCGTTIVSKMQRGNGTIFCMTPTPLSIRIGRYFQSRDEISIRGRGCNTLVLSMHLALTLHEHKHHWAFMSMSMSNSIFTTLLISHVMPLKFIPRLGFTCDQCVKCLWTLEIHIKS